MTKKKSQLLKVLKKITEESNTQHIVKLVETFEDNKHIYCVMEFMKGGSLENYLKDM